MAGCLGESWVALTAHLMAVRWAFRMVDKKVSLWAVNLVASMVFVLVDKMVWN